MYFDLHNSLIPVSGNDFGLKDKDKIRQSLKMYEMYKMKRKCYDVT